MNTPMVGKMTAALHMSRRVAKTTAKLCNKDDDEWTYRAVPSKRPGLYVLSATDKDGEFLGYI